MSGWNTRWDLAAIQRDLARLESWALMTFSTGKCKILCVLGDNRLESGSAEKNLEILVDTRLNMAQQGIFAPKKANSLLGCTGSAAIRWRELILPFCSALLRPHLECWVQDWAPQYKRDLGLLERALQIFRSHPDPEPAALGGPA